MLTLAFILATIFIFMQFGGRLAASQALLWWTTFVFLGVATAFPKVLVPVAYVMGVELVSNLVLAGMTMLLLFQSIEHSVIATLINRKLRLAIANSAAAEFVDRIPAFALPGDKVSALVVLPCFNEEDALPKVIDQIKSITGKNYNGLHLGFCLVNDGSTDRSLKILKSMCPDNYANHTVNIGVAGVLLTGFRIATDLDYDFVVQCDGDGQHPVQDIPDLVSYAAQKYSDLMIGSRHSLSPLRPGELPLKDQSTTTLRIFGVKILKISMSMFGFDAAVSDPTSGFRVFSQKAISKLLEFMPDEYPEPEAIVLLKIAGLKVDEVRVAMSPRTTGVSSLSGLKGTLFMIKVSSAILGLRLRTLLR